MIRNTRYGHPTGSALRDRELKKYRGIVAEGLARYREHAATQAAFKLTEALFKWAPRYGWHGELEAQAEFRRLQDAGVQPIEILQRVAEVYAVETFSSRARFRNKRERTFAVARAVLRLRSIGIWRPTSRVLQFVGGLLEDHLEGFTVSFLNRLQRDLSAHGELLKAARSFE